MEGGKEIVPIIKYLNKKGISVMGHVGLLPQTAVSFNVRGKNTIQKNKIFNDAMAISKSGAFAIIIECVVESLAKIITDNVKIPTIGIGASKFCDGQILVTDDMLGLTDFNPKFVKKYKNLNKEIEKSIIKYSNDVKYSRFPSIKNTYR